MVGGHIMEKTLELFDTKPYTRHSRIRTIVWQPRRTALSPGAVAALQRLKETLDELPAKERDRRKKAASRN